MQLKARETYKNGPKKHNDTDNVSPKPSKTIKQHVFAGQVLTMPPDQIVCLLGFDGNLSCEAMPRLPSKTIILNTYDIWFEHGSISYFSKFTHCTPQVFMTKPANSIWFQNPPHLVTFDSRNTILDKATHHSTNPKLFILNLPPCCLGFAQGNPPKQEKPPNPNANHAKEPQ